MNNYDSAERWNASNPPGTAVRVVLRNGDAFEAKTAASAQRWGDLALINLQGKSGVWTASALHKTR